LDSIFNQAKGRNCEVLLVDDQSDDVDELKIVAKRYPKVNVIEKPKKTNAADSRNIGISQALGEYIFLLDSDDQFCEGVIDRRIGAHERTEAGLIFGRYIVRNNSVDRIINFPIYHGGDLRNYLMVEGGDFRNSTVSLCRKYYLGSLFDSSSKKHQDWIFGILAFDKGERFAFDDQPSSIIVSDRSGRMSSSFNIQASKYFIDNYLNNNEQINGFCRKNLKFMIECRNKEFMGFLLSMYSPSGIISRLEFHFIKLIQITGVSCIVAPLIRFSRKLKYLI
jgi:glycosyltransferase involved in cell wall biosynthesis